MSDLLGRADGRPTARAALRAVKRLNRLAYSGPLPVLPDRFEVAELLNRRHLVGCGAEVGVKRGEFSAALLSTWRGRHLISIDPWRAEGAEYVDVANVVQVEHDAFHREATELLAPFGARSSVWRLTGDDAAARIPHHSLDFVYLDARHDRDSVAADLRTWGDRVRPGGVLAGHDYLDGVLPQGVFGVRTAVDEYCAARGLRARRTVADPPWPSWYVLLPRA